MKALFKKHNINLYSSFNKEIKAAVIERYWNVIIVIIHTLTYLPTLHLYTYFHRFQRTFKTKLWKYFAVKGSRRYVDDLQTLVKQYNNTPHRTLGNRKPSSIKTKQKEQLLLKTVYNRPKVFKNGKFKVGDYVRVGDYGGVFDKGYEPNYSTAIFVINEVRLTNPVTYRVTHTLTDEKLKRSYYESELKAVKNPDVYLVKDVIKKRGSKALVSYLGFSSKFNEWIDIKDFV